jgi:hypothetical protein
MPTLTTAHRRDLAELTGLAQKDLSLIWAKFNTATAARDGLMEVLPRLVQVYGSAAATLGADWYDEVRAEAAVKGRFRAIPAELPDQGRTDALARWGVTPLFQAEPSFDTALTLVDGGLQRIISNADRETVMGSAYADPSADGWQRTGSGECAFCDMLIGRGAVYSAATADFASHDHCKCSCEIAFSGKDRPVKAYTPSERTTEGKRRKAEAAPVSNEEQIRSLRGRLRAAEAAPGNNAIDIANLKQRIATLGG